MSGENSNVTYLFPDENVPKPTDQAWYYDLRKEMLKELREEEGIHLPMILSLRSVIEVRMAFLKMREFIRIERGKRLRKETQQSLGT